MSKVKEELSGIVNRKSCCRLAAEAIARRDIGIDSLRALIKTPCCKKAALRGAFLAGGSTTDPEKLYHMEIYCRSLEFTEYISEIMRDFNLSPKTIKRSDYYSVYLKDGEGIVDFLNITGAHKALMTFENVRIMKEMRSSVNRIVNCETANLEKTVNASVRQIGNIYLIRDTVGFDSLPDGLREIAVLRAENPEIGLKELGQTLVPPLGKSGVNHRLRKLDSIADSLRRQLDK